MNDCTANSNGGLLSLYRTRLSKEVSRLEMSRARVIDDIRNITK